MERECKLRQALTAMGLHDLAYWWQPPPPTPRTKWTRRVPHPVLIGHAAYPRRLSWHLYQSAFALLGAASLYPTCPHPANSTAKSRASAASVCQNTITCSRCFRK